MGLMFGRNLFNCECGGLRHICAKHGCLPESKGQYAKKPAALEYDVVWSGSLQREGAAKMQLLADRPEVADNRMASMPTYDLDDGEVVDVREHRRYRLTGKHVGKFSRTNPKAPHYKPTAPKIGALEETQPNG